ncbi:MAG: sulfur carrier protein ThiS adenylyltransferase ThiF [Candidatus Hydrogenedentes bacterium]|nr:sulfur carrier protein ThiS adenylyltransferase ThiF [Candidatus Hydrogenedentota bacterium]
MRIRLSEKPIDVPEGTTLFALRDRLKPGADVVVLNGAPLREDRILSENDEVVLIRRGEIPAPEEMEALMAARHTPGVHEVLKRSCVGIAGLGGLGSAIAIALARVGVGRLVLVDFDVVEPSNLNRQQYFVDQVGLLKTEALKSNLARVNPYVMVDTHAQRLTPENVPAIFASVDVLAEAFDAADQKAMLLECFRRARPGTPIVVATGLAGHAPSNTIVTRRMGNSTTVVGDLTTAAQPGTGLMAPRVGVAAHHQANAVLRILLGEDPAGA